MQNLISFVQAHARLKREDLACEVLALLLREQTGQEVIRGLIPVPEAAGYSLEVITRRRVAGCIPDILIYQNHRVVCLLELKFGAPLTDHQLSGRYSKISPRTIFVVPEERLNPLNERLFSLIRNQSLTLLSWESLLAMLEKAESGLETRERELFVGALEHLKEFCDVIKRERFDPFTSGQLSEPIQDVTTRHLVWLIDGAIDRALSEENNIKEAGRRAAGFDDFFYYGQKMLWGHFRGWLGYWPLAWKRYPEKGPLWVQFYGRDATALRTTGTFTDGLQIMGPDLAFPILTSSSGPFSSQEQEIEHVVAAISELMERLRRTSIDN